MGPCCTLGISRFDSMPKKNCVKQTDKFRTFWTISAKESHDAKGDSKNKENINESLGFIVLQTQLASIRGSRNKQIILDSHYSESYLLFNKSFFNHAFSVKMAGDWPRSFFWRFHGSRLCLALLTSRLVNNAYMIILRCLCNIVKEMRGQQTKPKVFLFWKSSNIFPSKLSPKALLVNDSCPEKLGSLKYSLRSSVPFVIILRNSRVLRAL